MPDDKLQEAREDFLKYLEVVAKNGERRPLKLTRFQRLLWDVYLKAAKEGKSVDWRVLKLSR